MHKSPCCHPSPRNPTSNLACRRQVDISDVEQFEALRQQEQQYFRDMVQLCKDSGATLIICQWGERVGRCGLGTGKTEARQQLVGRNFCVPAAEVTTGLLGNVE